MLRGNDGARAYSLCQQIQKELAILGAYYVVNYFYFTVLVIPCVHVPLKVAYFTCENENRYCLKRGRINWMKSARMYTCKSPIQESVLWLSIMTQHRKITVTFKFLH